MECVPQRSSAAFCTAVPLPVVWLVSPLHHETCFTLLSGNVLVVYLGVDGMRRTSQSGNDLDAARSASELPPVVAAGKQACQRQSEQSCLL